MACADDARKGLTIQQAFLLTTGVWAALPLFGALPFMMGEATLSGVYMETDDATGKAVRIEMVRRGGRLQQAGP